MVRVRGCKNIVRLWFMKLSETMLSVESGEDVKRSYFYRTSESREEELEDLV